MELPQIFDKHCTALDGHSSMHTQLPVESRNWAAATPIPAEAAAITPLPGRCHHTAGRGFAGKRRAGFCAGDRPLGIDGGLNVKSAMEASANIRVLPKILTRFCVIPRHP